MLQKGNRMMQRGTAPGAIPRTSNREAKYNECCVSVERDMRADLHDRCPRVERMAGAETEQVGSPSRRTGDARGRRAAVAIVKQQTSASDERRQRKTDLNAQ
jgi:hypothetical protein